MKNKLKIIFIGILIFSLGGCTNIQDTFSTTPTYTEVEKSNFNVQEEKQLFAMGSSKVNESGTAVAKMKAEKEAKTYLKKQIFNETTNVLNSFFNEVHTKNIIISKDTVEDLSNLVSSQLIEEAVETSSWNDQGKEFIVLAIDRNRVPEKVKETFVIHLQNIIQDLDGAINKVSKEYLEIATPPVVIPPKETPKTENKDDFESKDMVEKVQLEDDLEPKDSLEKTQSEDVKPENSSPEKVLEKNSEPEVFLDDF